ncbi:MAG: V-type ATP synthase subunit A [Methanobacteriota archaeon]|nr:MAG: V-type ATP synthase subunit A [Euryarchaeota archaeon]TLZ90770.1 MAG: V-type ATP synthase subunit A [Euryarchaeota archaeon]
MAMKGKEKAAAGKAAGEIFRVAGPVVTATGLRPRMYDVQFVGEEQLLGEVIQVVGEKTVIQVYEDTSGVRPGEAVLDTGGPLVVELGPGLLGSIYDGIQRPLPVLQKVMGDFILRGVKSPGLTREKSWAFSPKVQPGQAVGPGDVVGTVQEAKNVQHRIMVPPNFRGGKVAQIREGTFKVDEVVAQLDNGEQVKMYQTWPVRRARPVKDRLMPTIPLVTGQRVLDFLFPIAKGGTAAIPGGFGTGKCVAPDTLVMNPGGDSVRIDELYDRARGEHVRGEWESWIRLDDPIPILSFNGTEVEQSFASVLYRGFANCLVRIRTEAGRTLRVTPVHRLFAWRSGIVEVDAAQLGRGSCLAVPLEDGTIGKDVIVEAETIPYGSWVFDLTVPQTHNFVGGNLPSLLHNTVTEQQLSKWCDAQVVIYIGCGERGNEMTEVLTTFPKLEDPYTGAPLMERMSLIANTSNMPVAAREASVYTGMTLAEYYRDMGYNVALMADSTSRWAEAMREISSRLEEMPGEEGFPAYLSARLSEFYERAGRAKTLGGLEGSVSVVGAVSPSGGDFSEPVTQGTLRIVKVFWALDTALRARRHFPAINWLQSYSLYTQILEDWFRKNVNEEWPKLRSWTQRTLQEEAELEEIVRLVGADALPPDQQLTLEVARMIREIFLQQNAYHAVDTFCPPERQFKLIAAIKKYSDLGQKAVKLDVPTKDVASLKSRELLTRVKYETEFDKELAKTLAQMDDEFKRLGAT